MKKYDIDRENFKRDCLFNSIMNEPLQGCTLVNSLSESGHHACSGQWYIPRVWPNPDNYSVCYQIIAA